MAPPASLNSDEVCDPPARGRCVKCGYDLRGILSNRCPECGYPFALPELLKDPYHTGLMKPMRWIGPAAAPIAAITLISDAAFVFTQFSLLLLSLLWLVVAGPYIARARRRRKTILRYFPKGLVSDPDTPLRKRIAVTFLIAAIIIGSGLWQKIVFRFDLIWLQPYATHLLRDMPFFVAEKSVPGPWLGQGTLEARAVWIDPTSVKFETRCGSIHYSPDRNSSLNPSPSDFQEFWTSIEFFNEDTSWEIAPGWYVSRVPWNFLTLFPRGIHR
jgi:hypothetical protein